MKAGLGGGKYEEALMHVQEEVEGSVLLVVIGGKHGDGFAVAASLEVIGGIPRLLRQVADQVETWMRATRPTDEAP
jgi:hypothetical protein